MPGGTSRRRSGSACRYRSAGGLIPSVEPWERFSALGGAWGASGPAHDGERTGCIGASLLGEARLLRATDPGEAPRAGRRLCSACESYSQAAVPAAPLPIYDDAVHAPRRSRLTSRASGPGRLGSTSSRNGSRPALRACITQSEWAWRRRDGSPSGTTSMCALSAASCRPHSGQRYVLGVRFAAGRTAYQRASRNASGTSPGYLASKVVGGRIAELQITIRFELLAGPEDGPDCETLRARTRTLRPARSSARHDGGRVSQAPASSSPGCLQFRALSCSRAMRLFLAQ
jgi:hypothetical protein